MNLETLTEYNGDVVTKCTVRVRGESMRVLRSFDVPPSDLKDSNTIPALLETIAEAMLLDTLERGT